MRRAVLRNWNMRCALSWRSERRAHDFGEFAVGAAAIDIHLPEAVLRGDVALRDEHVLLRGGVDVGDAVLIAADGDRSGERRCALRCEMNVAIELTGSAALAAERSQRMPNAGEHDENRHQPCDGEEEDPGPAPLAAARL